MMETSEGVVVDFLNPSPFAFSLPDIILTLDRMPRYCGKTSRDYWVLEHSILCFYEARHRGYSKHIQRGAVGHDFSEAFLMDINTNLKRVLPKYREIEGDFTRLLEEKYFPNLSRADHLKIKDIDIGVRSVEMWYLMPSDGGYSEENRLSVTCPMVHDILSIQDVSKLPNWKEEFWKICEEVGLSD